MKVVRLSVQCSCGSDGLAFEFRIQAILFVSALRTYVYVTQNTSHNRLIRHHENGADPLNKHNVRYAR